MSFKPAILVILAVVIADIIFMLTGLYGIFPWLDIPMHFMGGFGMALLAFAIHSLTFSKTKTKQMPIWYLAIFIMGFTMMIGVAWEFHEYILDNTAHYWYGYPISQISLTDTMKDFLDDWLGASAAFLLFYKKVFTG